MDRFEPRDPEFAAKVRVSFDRQKVMTLFGATLARVEPGVVEIALPFRDDLTQQHGYFHAGVVSTIADSAGGFAGFSLMPAGSSILSVEFKIHLLAPADGDRLLARGRVVRAGRTLTVTEMSVDVAKGGETSRCAWGTQTLMRIERAERD
jgi:uncharacterized protein (TIGR00369 family)